MKTEIKFKKNRNYSTNSNAAAEIFEKCTHQEKQYNEKMFKCTICI